MNTEPITIRTLNTLDEFYRTEYVQRMAWSMGDAGVVPAHVTLTAQKNGGLVAGAFDAGGTMLGFLFSFLGLAQDKRLKHCSHMLGVLPEARQLNIGTRLKLFQRTYVQQQSIDLITWTYDPLEGRNAMLNIGKLGAIARLYRPNLYGEMTDGINAGLPSDRFEVEWWINSPHVQTYVDAPRLRPTLAGLVESGAQPALSARFNAEGLPEPVPGTLADDAPTLWVEVPADYQRVKAAAPALALDWRFQSRAIFTALFGRGYCVVDFLSEADGGQRRDYYVLRRQNIDL